MLVLTTLLANNHKARVSVNFEKWLGWEPLTPLECLNSSTTLSLNIQRDSQLGQGMSAISPPPQRLMDELAQGFAVQSAIDDFLHLQTRAGMPVRGPVLFDGILARMWVDVNHRLISTYFAKITAGPIPSIMKQTETQIRSIMASKRIKEIKQEAIERIAALQQS